MAVPLSERITHHALRITPFSWKALLVTRLKSASIVFLSSLTILIALLAFAQIDFQMVLFMRSVHNPILARLGNAGNWLGHGETLIILCLVVFLIGYVWKNQTWRLAGIDGVVAHAIAGIAVQIPKHLIGRPRPRWAHQGAFEFGPSFQGGLDAFPSGHAAASFAVAAVMARYFPRGTWLWYGMALFVAMSRVVKGSHFLTDALAGATLGFLVGYVWARPLKEWRASLLQAFPRCLPLVVVAFTVIWVACHKPDMSRMGMIMQWAGVGVCLLGIGLRMSWSMKGILHLKRLPPYFVVATASIGLGLGLVSQSFLVVGLVALALPAWWLIHEDPQGWWRPQAIANEIICAGVVIAIIFTLREIHGLVPLGGQ